MGLASGDARVDRMSGFKAWAAAAVAMVLAAGAGLADVTRSSANDPTGTIGYRLSALMGDEREALARLNPGRLARIGAPFTARTYGVDNETDLVFSAAALDAMPPATGGADWECLTEALYFEARGEGVPGQYAVAEVILNRVDSAAFPDSVCEVVNQGTGQLYACQFTYTCDGRPERVSERDIWNRLGQISRIMLDGGARELTGGATYYHTTAVSPRWSRVFAQTARIGDHIFYRQ